MFRSLLILLAVVCGSFANPASAADPADPAAVDRLAGALRFPTISHEDGANFDAAAFLDLHAYLAAQFPATHAALVVETVADYSLLFTWEGSDPSLKPILLTSHLDVVPVAPGNEDAWEQPAFGGVVADGYVWGRGAVDDKVGVLATLEAVEELVAAGFQPKRTVYLAFGHDEEIGGDAGAGALVQTLEDRGVRLWFSLDEGMVIAMGLGPVEGAAAMIGIAEKGFLTLELTAPGQGGHSSVPPSSTAIGRLARAITKLEEHPMPPRMGAVAGQMFDALAPTMTGFGGFAMRNRWLFGGLIESQLSGDPAMSAMIRTTTAVTMISGGVKPNVLPRTATASVNFRIIPGDTVESVTAAVREIIDDPEIEIGETTGRDPSAVSSADSAAFTVLADSIRAVAPDVVVAPALVVGGTDSKHYARIADDAYRFLPVRFEPGDLGRIHGVNERVSIDGYGETIAIYRNLIERAAGP